jgi:hypothetical protein
MDTAPGAERTETLPKSASWSMMLLETDPVPEVRMKRMCTGISNRGMAPGAGGADSAAVLAAFTGATGLGGAAAASCSSGGAAMATSGSKALACRTQRV